MRTKRVLIVFSITLIAFTANAQVRIMSERYYDSFRVGQYLSQSTNAAVLRLVVDTLAPQTAVEKLEENTAMLFPPSEGILLFSSRDGKRTTVKLLQPSLVQVDTIFYNHIHQRKVLYEEPELTDSVTVFSFDVWYSVRINGVRYYMDYQPHELGFFEKELPDHKQVFTIFGQNAGYDEYYDNGYPEHFHVVVFDETNKKMSLMYSSKELPYENGDEFWDIGVSVRHQYNSEKKDLEFTLLGISPYHGTWTGTELRQKQ